jgi:hypothetical protein|nr:MAG TPA: hypothetical protein [Crassvirales sp.]
MGKYDEVTVVRELCKNPAVTINGKVIGIIKDTNLIGNSFWGRIDFLTKYCGYTLTQVDLDEQRAAKIAEQEARKAAKAAARAKKRKSKVDIISSVKSSLSKSKFNRK